MHTSDSGSTATFWLQRELRSEESSDHFRIRFTLGLLHHLPDEVLESVLLAGLKIRHGFGIGRKYAIDHSFEFTRIAHLGEIETRDDM